jgi:hypothetical protein
MKLSISSSEMSLLIAAMIRDTPNYDDAATRQKAGTLLDYLYFKQSDDEAAEDGPEVAILSVEA